MRMSQARKQPRNVYLLFWMRALQVRALTLAGDPDHYIKANGADEYKMRLSRTRPLIEWLADRAREKFDISEGSGKADAARWMMQQLEHVAPQHRFEMSAEVSRYLQIPEMERADPNYMSS